MTINYRLLLGKFDYERDEASSFSAMIIVSAISCGCDPGYPWRRSIQDGTRATKVAKEMIKKPLGPSYDHLGAPLARCRAC